jgi:hypothetical protein
MYATSHFLILATCRTHFSLICITYYYLHVEEYFAVLTKNHYRDGIMALEHRWNKCISLKEDYVEK